MRTLPFATLALAGAAVFSQEYSLGPDSQPQPGIPKGKVTKHTWSTSHVFPGTTRDYSVYVPSQYDASKPACVMIFQDGTGFANETGAWRVPIVFDNLIHKGAMPVTIGIFVDPGVMPAAAPGMQSRFNRSYEYHGLGPRYARFLATRASSSTRSSPKLRRSTSSLATPTTALLQAPAPAASPLSPPPGNGPTLSAASLASSAASLICAAATCMPT